VSSGSALLAEHYVLFTTKGEDTLYAALELLKADFEKLDAAAQRVGGYLGGQFAAAQKLVTDTFTAKMKPAIQEATNNLVKMLAEEKNITEAQARSLVQWEQAKGSVESYGKSVQEWIGGAAHGAIFGLAAVMGGLVTQGLALSAQGQVMTARFQELSLTVAGLFGPEIRAVSQWIQDLTTWIRGLSDEQKDSIVWWLKLGGAVALASFGFNSIFGKIGLLIWAMTALNNLVGSSAIKWLAVAGAVLYVASIVPKVVAAINTMTAAVEALNVAEIIAHILAQDWATALAALAIGAAAGVATYTAISALQNSADQDGTGKSGGRGERSQAPRAVGGLEAIGASFDRVNVAFVNATAGVGKSPAETTNDKLDVTNGTLDDIRKQLGGQPPVIRK
jgi:hypothetical protein